MSERRMDAYYYAFDATGVDCVDKILSAVACAGKAYHHTDGWNDDAGPYCDHTGETPVEWIQNAAKEAAAALERIARERDEARVIEAEKDETIRYLLAVRNKAEVEIKRLRDALVPFARHWTPYMEDPDTPDCCMPGNTPHNVGDYRRARAAFAPVTRKKEDL
jgi:hypothetical protein